MNAGDYWNMFMETGAPEIYLLYTKAVKTEAQNVSKNKSTGPSGNSVQ